MWILALDCMLVMNVLVMNVNFLDWAGPRELSTIMSTQGHNVLLLHAAIAHVGLSKVQFDTPLRAALVWLVSGSSQFLATYQACPGQPTLLLLLGHYQAKHVVQEGPFTWTQLWHSLFSGSTLFAALIGTNIPDFAPIKTPLHCFLGHVLDHSVRPHPLQWPSGKALMMNDCLHPNLEVTEVTFQTSFTATGWGMQNLTPKEVGIAFAFPSWLQMSTTSKSNFPVVPLQILDGCL
jgi:hypothetical protein